MVYGYGWARARARARARESGVSVRAACIAHGEATCICWVLCIMNIEGILYAF